MCVIVRYSSFMGRRSIEYRTLSRSVSYGSTFISLPQIAEEIDTYFRVDTVYQIGLSSTRMLSSRSALLESARNGRCSRWFAITSVTVSPTYGSRRIVRSIPRGRAIGNRRWRAEIHSGQDRLRRFAIDCYCIINVLLICCSDKFVAEYLISLSDLRYSFAKKEDHSADICF